MIKDSLNSILDNLKSRTTNPFLGTLVMVWTIRNWGLVYALFTFNANSNLHSRQAYIRQHFEHQSFFWNMLIVVGITIGVLILTYLFLALSRLITDFYDKVVTPLISKATDKSSVILKSEYITLQNVVKNLEIRLEEERLAKVAAQNERDQIDTKLIAYANSSKLPVTTEEQMAESEKNIVPVAIDPLYNKVLNKISKDWSQNSFDETIDNILNSDPILNSLGDMVKYLQRINFIEFSSSVGNNKYYNLTEEGREFLQYYHRNYSED